MEGFEPVFLIVCYIVFPLGLGYASGRTKGALRACLTAMAYVLIFIWGLFFLRYFVYRLTAVYGLTAVPGPLLELVSIACSIFFLLPGWKLFEWGESWVGEEEKPVIDIYEKIETKIKGPLTQASQGLAKMESRINQISSKLEKMEFTIAGKLDNQAEILEEINRKFSPEGLESRLEDVHSEISALRGELRQAVAQTKAAQQPPAPIERPAFAPRKLTTEDGRRARLSGPEWQKKVAGYILGLAEGFVNIKLENHPEKGKPDFVIRHASTGKPLAVGACKAYTLFSYRSGRRGSSQRTVTSGMVVVERNFAKRHKIPLFMVVVNQRTGAVWFHTVSREGLDSFERVTTPSWLAEDSPPQEEVERNLQESLEFLKSLV